MVFDATRTATTRPTSHVTEIWVASPSTWLLPVSRLAPSCPVRPRWNVMGNACSTSEVIYGLVTTLLPYRFDRFDIAPDNPGWIASRKIRPSYSGASRCTTWRIDASSDPISRLTCAGLSTCKCPSGYRIPSRSPDGAIRVSPSRATCPPNLVHAQARGNPCVSLCLRRLAVLRS